MPIISIENPRGFIGEPDMSYLAQQLREARIRSGAEHLGPRALTASMQGETVVRQEFEMHSLGEEEPVTVPRQTIDNFSLHKPA